MNGSSFSRYGASLLAFGHLSGLYSASRHRHGHSRVKVKAVHGDKPSLTAQDMGISYESDPELYRAIHPVFSGRDQALAEPETAPQPEPVVQTVQQPGEFKPRLGWTWEV